MQRAYATAMKQAYPFTRHAHQRSAERSIPPLVVEAIITYGHSFDAGDGTRKYALTKEGMAELRQFTGRPIANAIDAYRRRNVYVVVARGAIVTVAYASKPLFH
jgi:hypothetical protein